MWSLKRTKIRECQMITLRINQKWFKEIRSGRKTEEYREIKPHNTRLLTSRNGLLSDSVRFILGYPKGTPAESVLLVEYLGYHVGIPKPEWCEPGMVGKECYVIRLGRVLEHPLEDYLGFNYETILK
jgi:hypothetical protein